MARTTHVPSSVRSSTCHEEVIRQSLAGDMSGMPSSVGSSTLMHVLPCFTLDAVATSPWIRVGITVRHRRHVALKRADQDRSLRGVSEMHRDAGGVVLGSGDGVAPAARRSGFC